MIGNHRFTCEGGCVACDAERCFYFLMPGDWKYGRMSNPRKWRCTAPRKYGAYCGIHIKMVRPMTPDNVCKDCLRPIATKAQWNNNHNDGNGCECEECVSVCWGDAFYCRKVAAERDAENTMRKFRAYVLDPRGSHIDNPNCPMVLMQDLMGWKCVSCGVGILMKGIELQAIKEENKNEDRT